MRLLDGTTLMHLQAPYDPAKAHEYYLRTRKLTGRKKGRNTFTVTSPSGKTVVLTKVQLAEQQAYAAKRVGEIKESLAKLGAELKKAMAEAKDKKAKADKPKTAAEKSEAARESKKYKDKHKQELATKAKTATKKKAAKEDDPVAQLESKITEVKGRLIAAVAKQRALATATKNT